MNRLTSLWHHPDFLKLWTAQTLAALSANVTTLAVPFIAALTLHASPFEMGLLSTMATLPNILIGLFVGPWADRARRRPLMITADIGRALVLVSIPIAALYHLLTIWQLYAVLFLCGVWTTVFDVAHVSYLPSLVKREALVSANSRLVGSSAVAGAVGPGLAGGLIQLLTAPIAIVVDACVLGLSAILVLVIRSPEPNPAPSTHHSSVWNDIFDGLHSIFADVLLRSIALSSMIYLFFNYTTVSVFLLYATRDLHLTPAALGIIFGLGGSGAVVGALIARHALHRFGIGPVLMGTNLLGGLFTLLVPFASAFPFAVVAVLGIAQCVAQMMGVIFYINRTSLIQGMTPTHRLGRMNASYRFLTMGTIPIGSFLGGLLGGAIGLQATLIVGGVGMLLSVWWLVRSPIRTLHA